MDANVFILVFTLSLSSSLDLPTPIYNSRLGERHKRAHFSCIVYFHVRVCLCVCDLPAVHFDPIIYSDYDGKKKTETTGKSNGMFI